MKDSLWTKFLRVRSELIELEDFINEGVSVPPILLDDGVEDNEDVKEAEKRISACTQIEDEIYHSSLQKLSTNMDTGLGESAEAEEDREMEEEVEPQAKKARVEVTVEIEVENSQPNELASNDTSMSISTREEDEENVGQFFTGKSLHETEPLTLNA